LARRDRDETFVALEMVTTTASACRRLFDETPTRSEGWQEPSEHLSVISFTRCGAKTGQSPYCYMHLCVRGVSTNYRSRRWLRSFRTTLKMKIMLNSLTNLIQPPFWWKYRNVPIKSGTISTSHFNLLIAKISHNNKHRQQATTIYLFNSYFWTADQYCH